LIFKWLRISDRLGIPWSNPYSKFFEVADLAEDLRFGKLSSVLPGLVADGQAVQSVPVGAPFGEVLVHEGLEAGVVRGFQKVHELVDHDVFEALGRLFGEIGVEADAVG
jgi:hypothetical protein